jgi:hypothetical protein
VKTVFAFVLLLCSSVSLFANHVPLQLTGKTIKYILDKTEGEFAQYRGHVFETSFLQDNRYQDVDSTTGIANDEGTYHYFTTGEDTAEIHYVIETEGPWKGMHLSEKLRFTSTTAGTVVGEHVGDFDCGYSGTFTIH